MELILCFNFVMINLRNNGDFIRYHICDISWWRVFNLLRPFQRSEIPCKHSFSHACLYSYIASHCTSTESRLGFHCQICRVYIPNTRAVDNSKETVSCFLKNFVLEKYAHSSGQRFCEACLRQSEEDILIATKKCKRTAQNTTTDDH